MTRDVVRAGYDEIGEKYHSWSHASEVRLGFVQRVLDRLPPGQLSIARRLAPRAALVQADLVELVLQPSSVDAVVSFYALGIGRDATLAAVEAAGMTIEDAQVVGEDEGEDRIVAFLWVTAVKRG